MAFWVPFQPHIQLNNPQRPKFPWTKMAQTIIRNAKATSIVGKEGQNVWALVAMAFWSPPNLVLNITIHQET